jgi:hypothetical protein
VLSSEGTVEQKHDNRNYVTSRYSTKCSDPISNNAAKGNKMQENDTGCTEHENERAEIEKWVIGKEWSLGM